MKNLGEMKKEVDTSRPLMEQEWIRGYNQALDDIIEKEEKEKDKHKYEPAING